MSTVWRLARNGQWLKILSHRKMASQGRELWDGNLGANAVIISLAIMTSIYYIFSYSPTQISLLPNVWWHKRYGLLFFLTFNVYIHYFAKSLWTSDHHTYISLRNNYMELIISALWSLCTLYGQNFMDTWSSHLWVWTFQNHKHEYGVATPFWF